MGRNFAYAKIISVEKGELFDEMKDLHGVLSVVYKPFKISRGMPELRASSLRTVFNPIKALTVGRSPLNSRWHYTKVYYQHDPVDEIKIAIKLADFFTIESYTYLLKLHKSKKYGRVIL